MWVKLAQNNDAVFCSGGDATFVKFDFGEGHGRQCLSEDMFEGMIFSFSDVVPCVGSVMEAKVFLLVESIPDVFVVF